jgi:16S rRNA (guanine527-N7)-methyltransferase
VSDNVAALIEQGMAALGLAPPQGSVERLSHFVELLKKWNRGQNLTAITEPHAMVARHVLDSLAGTPWVTGTEVLDVGSGAGLPGLPLAIADPSRHLVLLDSRGKRIQFLLHARQVLKLENVDVVQARFEKYQPQLEFDTLVARAFAALPTLLRSAAPFIAAGTRLVVWQRNDPSAELQEVLAGRPLRHRVHAVEVPGIAEARHIAVVERSGARLSE